jgi:hypothetical protein
VVALTRRRAAGVLGPPGPEVPYPVANGSWRGGRRIATFLTPQDAHWHLPGGVLRGVNLTRFLRRTAAMRSVRVVSHQRCRPSRPRPQPPSRRVDAGPLGPSTPGAGHRHVALVGWAWTAAETLGVARPDLWESPRTPHANRAPQASVTRGSCALRIVIRARSRFQPRAENVTVSTSPAW